MAIYLYYFDALKEHVELFQIMSVVNGNIFNSTTNTKPVKPNTK